MQLRTDPMVATVRLSKALEPPIMAHCCAQASRYPIELNNPELAIRLGTKALQNGCPDIAELLTPLALAHAIQQEWEKSEQVLNKVESDPFGYKPVIETAIGLRKNNLDPLNEWALRSQDKYPEMTLDTIKNELRTRAEALFKEDSGKKTNLLFDYATIALAVRIHQKGLTHLHSSTVVIASSFPSVRHFDTKFGGILSTTHHQYPTSRKMNLRPHIVLKRTNAIA